MSGLVSPQDSGSRRRLRIGWVGFHREGVPALEALIERGGLVGALTLTPAAVAKRSGAADVAGICERAGVPVTRVDHVNDAASLAVMRSWEADVVFVIGWSQILGPEALGCARIGTIGAHASLLPRLRGSAPINWALIRGETVTGNSLMWLDTEVDDGDLVAQRSFPITAYDTCATLYDRVAETNAEMILEALDAFEEGRFPRTPQGACDEPLLPRRRPSDGLLDWSLPAEDVDRFVRALTEPYPGAFTTMGETRVTVWSTAALEGLAPTPGAQPGEVVGAMRSPVAASCGVVVACGSGAVVLVDVDVEGVGRLVGPALADYFEPGRRLG